MTRSDAPTWPEVPLASLWDVQAREEFIPWEHYRLVASDGSAAEVTGADLIAIAEAARDERLAQQAGDEDGVRRALGRALSVALAIWPP